MDLFSNDFIVIPVNKSEHWRLVIVCYAQEAFRTAANQTPDLVTIDDAATDVTL